MMRSVFLLLMFAANSLLAQEMPLQHYGVKEGLSHATVYRIYQDRKGFLWFCTDYGLSMFNGRVFKNYTTAEGLSDNTILSVSECADGKKLISTFRGSICVLDGSNISRLNVRSGNMPKAIEYAVQYGSNTWILDLSQRHIFLLRNDTISERLLRTANDADVWLNRISRCGNDLFIATHNGIYRIGDDASIQPAFVKSIDTQFVNDIKLADDHTYYISLKDKLVQVHNDSVLHSWAMHSQSGFGDMLVDSKGNLWLTISGHIYCIHDGKLADISALLNTNNIFINDLFEDREGDIWFASHGQGIYKLNTTEVINFAAAVDKVNIYCREIDTVNDELWFASVGMISAWRNGVLKKLPFVAIQPAEAVYFVKQYGNKVYIGTSKKVLRKDLRHPNEPERIIWSYGGLSICRNGKQEIIIGAYNGMFRINDTKVTAFDSTGYLSRRRCNSLIYDKDILWIGTDSGLIKVQGKVYSYERLPINSSVHIQKILADSRGRLWFAGFDGLFCKTTGGYKRYTIDDGLLHNSCKDLFEDKNGNIWVATLKGINIIDAVNGTVDKFETKAELSEILSLFCKNDTIYAGTIEGVSVLRNEQIVKNRLPVYITDIRTSDTVYGSPGSLKLSYSNKKVLIDFIALGYYQPDKINYRYKVDGFDSTWRYTTDNTVDVSALQPGNYTFRLSARYNTDEWQQEVVLPISISRPFWLQLWFVMLMGLFIVVCIYITIRWWYNGKKRKIILYNKIVYLRQQALSALINPHFMFNCMNAIQLFLYKNDTRQASAYLTKFALLVRITMEDVQSAFIGLEREISRLELYLDMEKLRFGEGLQYSISVDSQLQTGKVRIPNMILQPYIENAIWHGIMPKDNTGSIHISFEAADEANMCITIKDDGIGFDPKTVRKKDSLGMKLTESRVQLLNRLLNAYYVVHVASAPGCGTTVTLTLPQSPDEQYLSVMERELSTFRASPD